VYLQRRLGRVSISTEEVHISKEEIYISTEDVHISTEEVHTSTEKVPFLLKMIKFIKKSLISKEYLSIVQNECPFLPKNCVPNGPPYLSHLY
jgi:hypothetical protein